MSVPKWKRKESPVAFLDNAREILVLTYRMAKKLPKSATFYFSLDLFSYAKKAYEFISIANATDNRSEEGRSIRKQKFSEAIGEYESMDMLAGLAYEAITEKKFTDKELAELGTRIDTERKLLKGVMSSDDKKLSQISIEISDKG